MSRRLLWVERGSGCVCVQGRLPGRALDFIINGRGASREEALSRFADAVASIRYDPSKYGDET